MASLLSAITQALSVHVARNFPPRHRTVPIVHRVLSVEPPPPPVVPLRHDVVQTRAGQPAEVRRRNNGILSAVGARDPVGRSEKVHPGEAEIRPRTSRVGEYT